MALHPGPDAFSSGYEKGVDSTPALNEFLEDLATKWLPEVTRCATEISAAG